MLEPQRQTVDVKPLPPLPPNTAEGTVGNDYPGQTTSDQKETSGLFKRLTSKLISANNALQFNPAQTSVGRTSTVRAKNSPPLTNDFTNKEHRDAALRERGLIAAPKKDLSQLEQDRDRKYTKVTPIPRDQTASDGQQSAAEKIRQEWKAKN